MTDVSLDSTLWLRRYHPAIDSAQRLVCLPHAGGSASFYFPVSAALSPRTEVLAVQYPGRQDRYTEPVIDDIGLLADRVARELLPLTDRPLALFGHSMGALVAFETALRLERAGHRPSHLFVSGRRSASAQNSARLHRLDDEGLLAEVRKLSGTDPRALADDELMRLVLPALRADYRAVELYRGDLEALLQCPVTVLTGDDDPRVTIEEAHDWERHTSGDFDVRVFPGGHFYLTDRAAEVLAVIREALDIPAEPS
ncbi:thioesterase II family protein [Streptacidiphilus sp. EB129]|uniref:thioesterase II family protein n=1 Tax=Streptacidiphilus sp. EB129 TaxID=3156262 RepID=UPI003512C4BD